MIQAQLLGESIASKSAAAFSLYEKSRFGEKQEGKIIYAPVEALFLTNVGKMKVLKGKKEVREEELIRMLKNHDAKIETKLIVFTNLRKQGYIIKSALKFGGEFRVYEKGIKPGEDHAPWILYTVRESDKVRWHEFAAQNRVAHSTKKRLLIAIVDNEGDVTYYDTRWMRM